MELKELEQQSHKRHTDFRRRVNQLDHNVASWTSRFAEEIVQRDTESVVMYDDFVSDPLERSVERFMRLMDAKFSAIRGSVLEGAGRKSSLDTSHVDDGDVDDSVDADYDNDTKFIDYQHENDEDDDFSPSLQSLSLQVSRLSRDMMQHTHVTLPSLRDQHLDSFHRKLKAEIPTKLHMEKTKAAKREQSIFQKFESMAGLASRSLAEENAVRIASLKILEIKILEAGGWDEKRTCRFLDEVKEIRKMLEDEREERVQSDERVLENIVKCRVQLQKALLEAMADE